ncbi:MAG TPA: GAF domain-containing protein, partial [Sphingobacterium sp.]|nr:GAF domain-containing protein [Sphingobacterium sp.]
ERYKTDGIEHNMYIGASIAPDRNFELYYLRNLRLWQLQVMCAMEQEFRQLQPSLPHLLEVTSLILVFATPISIRFRMDEKQFDIDGSYNVRYEIAKKRIDKAKIKGSTERITQKGKLVIVYSNIHEETEYLGYINLLQHKGLLQDKIEQFEVEDLQGLVGLKAIRVGFHFQEQ